MVKHIQQSGAKAGQWVHCPAEKQCRNGNNGSGRHIENEELYKVALWKKDENGNNRSVPLSTLTLADVEAYDHVSVEDKAIYNQMRTDQLKAASVRNKRKAQSVVTPEELTRILTQMKVNKKPPVPYATHKNEVSRTDTTVTLKNGMVVSRAKYSEKEVAAAKDVYKKAHDILNRWHEAPISYQEASSFYDLVRKSNMIASVPGSTTSIDEIYGRGIVGLTQDVKKIRGNMQGNMHAASDAVVGVDILHKIISISGDTYFGYKDGEFERIEEYKKQQSTPPAPKPEPEPVSQPVETSHPEPTQKKTSKIKNFFSGWKVTEF